MRIFFCMLMLLLMAASFGATRERATYHKSATIFAGAHGAADKEKSGNTDDEAKKRARREAKKRAEQQEAEKRATQSSASYPFGAIGASAVEQNPQPESDAEKERRKREEQKRLENQKEEAGRRAGQEQTQGAKSDVVAWIMSFIFLGGLFALSWKYTQLSDEQAKLREENIALRTEFEAHRRNADAEVAEIRSWLRTNVPLAGSGGQIDHGRLREEVVAEVMRKIRTSRPATDPRAIAITPPAMSYADDYQQVVTPSPQKAEQTRVSTYLKEIGFDGLSVRPVPMIGEMLELTEAGSGDRRYVLISHEQPGVFVVIPCLPRFNSKQDYNHYSNFYACERPSIGELWVVEPALAIQEDSEHWRLYKRGQLRIE